MAVDWKQYQQEAAEFFRSLGMRADVDVTLQGTRTSHDVDVAVKFNHVGFEVLWLVECKHWKSPVSKLHVLGLREIVADLGADRGIILCEAGFQSGAREAANLTNVRASSLATLSVETKKDVSALRIRELADRVGLAKTRYWDLDKSHRIAVGLRAEAYEHGYSGNMIIQYSEMVLNEARVERYPIQMGEYSLLIGFNLPKIYRSIDEVVTAFEPMLADLEERLAKAHAMLQ